MIKESFIEKIIRENRLNDISNTLNEVSDVIALFDNILNSVAEYFDELDRFYDQIMGLKYVGQAPELYANLSPKKFKLCILIKKRDAIKTKLEQDSELREATAKINRILKRNKLFTQLGLKIYSGSMSADDVLFNYYKLIESKKELEQRSNLYKR